MTNHETIKLVINRNLTLDQGFKIQNYLNEIALLVDENILVRDWTRALAANLEILADAEDQNEYERFHDL